MLQEVATKTQEEVSLLGADNRLPKGSIDLSIGGSADRRESWLQRRGPLIRQREDYTKTKRGEEGVGESSSIREKRTKRDVGPDKGARSQRKIRFGRENRIGQGSDAITPSERYPVANHEKRTSPTVRISGNKEKMAIHSKERLNLTSGCGLLRWQKMYVAFGFSRSQFQPQEAKNCAQDSIGELVFIFCCRYKSQCDFPAYYFPARHRFPKWFRLYWGL